jgi:hypothetical protein
MKKGGGFKCDVPFLDKKYVCSELKLIEEYAITRLVSISDTSIQLLKNLEKFAKYSSFVMQALRELGRVWRIHPSFC